MKSNSGRRRASVILKLHSSILFVLIVGCVGLDGAPCPCADDHSCFEPTNMCMPTISYPTDGTRPNLLAQTHTIFRSDERLGFVADMPLATELVVRVTANEESTDDWYYSPFGSQDWHVAEWDGGSQEFAAARDGLLDLDEFHFKGIGSATVEYFEHGAVAPTFSKSVFWAP